MTYSHNVWLAHSKARRHDFIDAFSRPVPFGHAIPHLFAFRLNLLQQFLFVQAKILAVVDQGFAVDDDRAHVPAHGGFHQGSNRIAHSAEGNVPQVDDRDVGLRAFLQPSQVVPSEHLRAAQGRRVEHVPGMAGHETFLGHPRSQRGIAHVRNNIFGKRVRTDAHGDPGFEILIEGFHGDAELQILERAIGNGSAGVGDDFQIVPVGVGEPAMAADEDAVGERHFRIEKADLIQQLDGRAALALHHRVKFEEINRGMNLNANSRFPCSLLRIFEKLRRARIHVAGKQHRGHAVTACAVEFLGKVNGGLSGLCFPSRRPSRIPSGLRDRERSSRSYSSARQRSGYRLDPPYRRSAPALHPGRRYQK